MEAKPSSTMSIPNENSAAELTADQFQRIATVVSNKAFCRHWLHFSYPSQEPWLMALQIRDHDGIPIEMEGLEEKGLFKNEDLFYIARRVDEKGDPFTSDLV